MFLFLLALGGLHQGSSSVDIFFPDIHWWKPGVQYGRIIQLMHGTNGSSHGRLLATSEKTGIDNGLSTLSHPIFSSSNGGVNWTRISDVTTAAHGGMRWEPHLLELPHAVGALEAGTVLCAGLAISHMQHGILKLFASRDGGYSWTFISDITHGGPIKHGVWEPFLVVSPARQLMVFYSDERAREQHSQMIVHQVSDDGGQTWGPVVRDVALPQQSLRPGMPSVSLLPSGEYFMTYEMCGMKGNPVHYRKSSDLLHWGNSSDPGTKLTSVDNVTPGSSPYNVWSPVGGAQGSLIVSACFQVPHSPRGSDFFVSHDLAKTWKRVEQPLPYTVGNGYSHGMAVSLDGHTLYTINNIDWRTDLHMSKLSFAPMQLWQHVDIIV